MRSIFLIGFICGLVPAPAWAGLEVMSKAPIVARSRHSAVSTGDQIIIWGGYGSVAQDGNTTTLSTLGDGAIYDPATNSWKKMSQVNAPSARRSHYAFWTGSRMIVWGGCEKFALGDCQRLARSGGLYDPKTDVWTPIATKGSLPVPPNQEASLMPVYYSDGHLYQVLDGQVGIYDIAKDRWSIRKIAVPPPNAIAPSDFTEKSAATSRGIVYVTKDVAKALYASEFDPLNNEWVVYPEFRRGDSCNQNEPLWADGKLFVVGGLCDRSPAVPNFSIFDRAKGVWRSPPGFPDRNRIDVQLAATRNFLFVWGGSHYEPTGKIDHFNDLNAFDLSSKKWVKISDHVWPNENMMITRGASVTTVGDDLVIWGGEGWLYNFSRDGAVFKP